MWGLRCLLFTRVNHPYRDRGPITVSGNEGGTKSQLLSCLYVLNKTEALPFVDAKVYDRPVITHTLTPIGCA